MEDHYFVSLPEGFGGRLSAPLAPHTNQEFGAGAYLPRETYQVSRYSFADPAVAWRGLNAALSSRVSAFEAAYVSDALEALVKPYGVDEPPEFFKAAGSEIVTASLDETSEDKVLVVSVRERGALLARVRAALGASPRTEKVGGEEMLISDDEGRAASLSGEYLVMGNEEDVRRCLLARAAGRTMKDAQSFLDASRGLFTETPFVTSVASDRGRAGAVVDHLAGRRGPHLHGRRLPDSSRGC